MSGHHVQVFSAGGVVRHVAISDAPLPAERMVEEFDAAGAPVALDVHRLELEDAAGNPPARLLGGRELLEALELEPGGLRRPRFRAAAAAELRALRLVDRTLPAPPAPPPPPPELGGAASLAIDGGYLEQTPPGWRDRLAAWWKGTA